jgi:hypothetical protein
VCYLLHFQILVLKIGLMSFLSLYYDVDLQFYIGEMPHEFTIQRNCFTEVPVVHDCGYLKDLTFVNEFY